MFDAPLAPLVAQLAPRLRSVRAFVVLTDKAHMPQARAWITFCLKGPTGLCEDMCGVYLNPICFKHSIFRCQLWLPGMLKGTSTLTCLLSPHAASMG